MTITDAMLHRLTLERSIDAIRRELRPADDAPALASEVTGATRAAPRRAFRLTAANGALGRAHR